MDIYFLLDQSNSMKPYKEQLIRVVKTLGSEIKKLTNNYTLGFGTFREKPVTPFDAIRDYVYDFEHIVRQTSDLNKFTQ